MKILKANSRKNRIIKALKKDNDELRDANASVLKARNSASELYNAALERIGYLRDLEYKYYVLLASFKQLEK